MLAELELALDKAGRTITQLAASNKAKDSKIATLQTSLKSTSDELAAANSKLDDEQLAAAKVLEAVIDSASDELPADPAVTPATDATPVT